MKLKKCISILAIALLFLSTGIQAIVLLETTTLPSVTLNAMTSKTWDYGIIHPDGGGGDDVDGPGWPK